MSYRFAVEIVHFSGFIVVRATSFLLQHSDLKHLPNGYGLSSHHHSTIRSCPFGHSVVFRQPDVVPVVMMEDCWLTGPVGRGDRLVLPHAARSVATCNVQTNDAIVKIVLTFLQHDG